MRTHLQVMLPGVLLVSTAAPLAQKPQLADVLSTAGGALVAYTQRMGATAADEEYVQYDTSSGQMRSPTRLGAQVVWTGGTDGSVAGYRDVYAIDSKSLGNPVDRLAGLFKTLPSGADQAQQLSEASVQYYVSPNLHALDQPMLALAFLRNENQDHSTFKLDGVKTMNGAQVAIVKFTETRTPRLIPSADNAPAIGRFWIDVASGGVRQTELAISGNESSVRVTVTYKPDQGTGLWLPSDMEQTIDITSRGAGASNMGAGGYGGHQSLEGRATYSKYRRLTP